MSRKIGLWGNWVFEETTQKTPISLGYEKSLLQMKSTPQL